MLNNKIIQMITKLKQSQNPMAFAQQLAGRNPALQNALQQLQTKNPQEKEQFVRNLYKSRNQDINQVANQYGLNLPQPPQA